MEEYIYILIGVIWIAASIYKATKKSRKQASPQGDGQPRRQPGQGLPDARSILEEWFGEHEVKVPEPEVRELYEEEPYIPPRAEKKKTVTSFQEEYASFGFKGLEALSVEGASSTRRSSPLKGVKKDAVKKPPQRHVNLRKAIIYSTILERPYT